MGSTFRSQDSLPKLPIPDLRNTCARYLAALRPLQDDIEHAESEQAVSEFLASEGPELQNKLKQYATGQSSYIEQFWHDLYLNYDDPVVLNLNPFFLLEDDPTPARNNQVTRAASLVISALSFVRALRKEELPPDSIRGTPLCMYQYTRMFGTARIPTDHGCFISQAPDATHIVVLCRGQFYYFDVLNSSNDIIMSEKDVSRNLEAIVDDAAQTPIFSLAKGALGVLSTENRKTWSRLRGVMSGASGSHNDSYLQIIDSALFILCLDHTEPQTQSELCMNMLCGTSVIDRGVQVGTCTNRWYDKLQIIVCANGSAGINFEHTGVDGHTVLRFASDVYTDTILRFAKSINGQAPSLWASTSPPNPSTKGLGLIPRKLEWEKSPELLTALRFAETRLADLIQQNEFATLDLLAYGKSFITSMGFSPDAYVQMAFQAAYYGMYGRVESVYEPAMTKTFYHSRTEAIRSVTLESVDFVKTFWAELPSPEDKVAALKRACEKHVKTTRMCAKAEGFERHLYALYCLWRREVGDALHGGVSPLQPKIFADSGWSTLSTTILSTSNCGNPSLRHFGFGPTSSQGFGIGYIIKDNSVSICASSKHRQTKRFVDALEECFLEMRRLLRMATGGSVAKGRGLVKVLTGLPVADHKAEMHEEKVEHNHDEEDDEEDEGMGGYGFFDAGILLQVLKGKSAEK
ncbi:carnitine acetyl transferase [Piedraia hortae CBS 480.64]|uniref:Carnitine acetyl transferase n=1 Tax=Piedraia hortae CBS 480.64 TaxID=1314780 RepID=A0A6A7BTP8_9PEZI|nr:carnitine acetyl transferase [Piedraia hortae CBS 480.64]